LNLNRPLICDSFWALPVPLSNTFIKSNSDSFGSKMGHSFRVIMGLYKIPHCGRGISTLFKKLRKQHLFLSAVFLWKGSVKIEKRKSTGCF
jgi:hypothetical protein